MSATVALIHHEDRVQAIRSALDAIAEQIDLRGRRHVLVKPNLVAPAVALACTHPDTLAAVLDFVRARYDGPLSIAEGSAIANTQAAFQQLGIDRLAQEYRAELIDLNAADTIAVTVYDRSMRRRELRMARCVVESDFRISVGPPKSHDTVLVTLSIKNMVMGALVNRALAHHTAGHPPRINRVRRVLGRLLQRAAAPDWVRNGLGATEGSDKVLMHQGYPAINLNLAMLAPLVLPHLAVIDGHLAMEGAGPVDGEPLPWRIALAGTDALATDWLCTWLMGLEPHQVGYLHYCAERRLGVADPAAINVIGNIAPATARRHFRLHPTAAAQRKWQTKMTLFAE